MADYPSFASDVQTARDHITALFMRFYWFVYQDLPGNIKKSGD